MKLIQFVQLSQAQSALPAVPAIAAGRAPPVNRNVIPFRAIALRQRESRLCRQRDV
jgi:hypothetical protein